MDRKTYTTRSNAKRAAVKLSDKLGNLLGTAATVVDVVELADKAFGLVVTFDCAAQAATAADLLAGHASTITAPAEAAVGYTADELDAMGLYGTGTDEDTACCPHCGINHIDNGYQTADGVADAGGTIGREYVCLACGGEWGAPVQGFAAKLAAYIAGGKSKCASLRQIAHEWPKGDRKGYIAAAVAAGVKPATASANWAAMKRGEW